MSKEKKKWSLERAQEDYRHKRYIKRDCINCEFCFRETYHGMVLNYYCNVKNKHISFTANALICKYFTLKEVNK